MATHTIIILLIIGLAAGMLSGLVGVGGGIIIVPALIFILGYSQHEAQGASLGLLLTPVGILAVMNYYKKGYIDFRVIAIMCVAFIAGAYLGSKISLSMPEQQLKKLFAIVLLMVAGKMLFFDKQG